MCYAGVEMLAITPDGRIFRAHCKQGGVIGSIYDQNIAFPVLPILCQKESCAVPCRHNDYKRPGSCGPAEAI